MSRTSSGPIRVAIVSRQEVTTRGLISMLADYPHRVTVVPVPHNEGECEGVDVVLYDTMCLHGNDGEGLNRLLNCSKVAVLVYVRDLRPDLRSRALAKGATMWISMSMRAPELVEAIQLAVEGETLPDPSLQARLGLKVGLTSRELEIPALVTQGRSNQEIAEKLGIADNTLKSHVRRIYRKIGVTSRSQAVSWAMQEGFLPDV